LPGAPALEVHAAGADDPWGLMTLVWASGKSKIEWFDTKAELDRHLKTLKEKK
jgi:hypothetical protein